MQGAALSIVITDVAFRDGTTGLLFSPLDFIARRVALVPKPRHHLVRHQFLLYAFNHDRLVCFAYPRHMLIG